MNERIHDLAMLARKHFPKTETSGEFWVLDEEKFAELIVAECVRYFNEDYTRDFDTLWREDLSRGIKEHFGVEE